VQHLIGLAKGRTDGERAVEEAKTRRLCIPA
jgi:hypothetical protein